MKIELRTIRVVRAERFVGEKLPFLRANFVQKLFRKKEIKVGKTAVKSGAKIPAGESVAIFLPDPRKYFREITGNSIIFEDKNVIAFDKKAGIATHAGVGTRGDDLRNCAEILLGLKLVVVHRIDRGTSGVVIFAKNPATARKLENEFRERKVDKKYFALVAGIPRNASGKIDFPLRKSGEKMIVAEGGLAAETFWKMKKRGKNSTLLEVEIATGRTHQIRAHFAAAGMPIVGDEKYSGKKARRIFLHAAQLRILDYNFEAKIPTEFDEN